MSLTIESPFHYSATTHGRKRLRAGNAKEPAPVLERVPRISRLMALAIHFDGLIREGIVRDYADLARLGGVSRARITQIMNLLNLPPGKQEEILFLSAWDEVTEKGMRQEGAKPCQMPAQISNDSTKGIAQYHLRPAKAAASP